MAEQRSSRTEKPASDAREKRADARAESRGDARPKADSQLRLVTADAIFPEEAEPNDESPTIISKIPVRGSDSSVSQDVKDLRGRKLLHFELIEPIGVGGMAAVFRARDTQLDRLVALKILPPEMAADPENVRRFAQEARAAAKLDNEYIARVFFCGEDQGLHFIAFEYVEGENLRVILERRGRLPVAEAIRHVLHVATGLEHAASRGVVHRDIKPSNIIINPNGRAKIVDMGLARSLEPHADNGLTQSGVTLGTFDYISPEQALEPREADSRSDVYSLGCTLYHMLTGQPPVPEGTAAKKLHHHQHVAPVDPRQINPDIPDEVALILSKMMAKNPRDRYQRPVQLHQHLSLALKHLGGEDHSSEAIFVDVQMPIEPRRRPVLMISMAALALAAVLFLLSLVPQGPTPTKNNPPKKPPVDVAVKTTPDQNPTPNPPNPTPKVTPTPVAVIRTEDDLQRALADVVDGNTILVNNDLVLTGKLKLSGVSNVSIVGKNTKLTLKLDAKPGAPVSGLVIDNAGVTFSKFRIEIDAAAEVKRPDVPVAAVTVLGGSKAIFEKCVFAQSAGLSPGSKFIDNRSQIPAVCLAINATVGKSGPKPSAHLKDCYFATGQTAIAVTGSGFVDATDCAFHTFGSLFLLQGGGQPVVALEHCSAYLRNGPAFRIDDDTAPKIKADYCIFDVPEKGSTGDNPNLIHQTDSGETKKVLFQGHANVYHKLNSVWVAKDTLLLDPGETADKVARAGGGYDKDSEVLSAKDSKLPAAARHPFINDAATADEPFDAFELNPDVKELRPARSKHPGHILIGARQILDRAVKPVREWEETLPAVAEIKLAPNEKIVEPDTFARALVDAKPGDVLILKPGVGDFSIKPTNIDGDVTLRAYPGSQPTVTLADYRYKDASLFHLLGGRLQLENLNFVIEPSHDQYTAQAVVTIAAGSCQLKGCTVTLKPRDVAAAIPLSVVTVSTADDPKLMMNDARSAPAISVQDCFIRGDGDLVSLRVSRPINVSVDKSLVCLTGSLLDQAQGAAKDFPADANISIKASNSVFLCADTLLSFKVGKATPYQAPLRVDQADHCLFVRLSDKPLAAIEMTDMTEKNAKGLFDWKGQKNSYVHFGDAFFFEHTPVDNIDEAGWKSSVEPDAEFPSMKLKNISTGPLWQITPADAAQRFEGAADLQPYFMQLPRFTRP